MYHELLMEHYKFPHHKKTVANPTIVCSDFNASCGDRVTFYIKLENQTIHEIGFEGSGCIISQASADILADQLLAQPLEKIETITSESLQKTLEIELGPNRLKCALLALHVLQKAKKKAP